MHCSLISRLEGLLAYDESFFPDVKKVPLVVDADQDPAIHPAPLTLEVLHVELHD